MCISKEIVFILETMEETPQGSHYFEEFGDENYHKDPDYKTASSSNLIGESL